MAIEMVFHTNQSIKHHNSGGICCERTNNAGNHAELMLVRVIHNLYGATYLHVLRKFRAGRIS